MLYEWVGDAKFRKGMHNYLRKFSYAAAQTEDLWRELEAASDLPVAKAQILNFLLIVQGNFFRQKSKIFKTLRVRWLCKFYRYKVFR